MSPIPHPERHKNAPALTAREIPALIASPYAASTYEAGATAESKRAGADIARALWQRVHRAVTLTRLAPTLWQEDPGRVVAKLGDCVVSCYIPQERKIVEHVPGQPPEDLATCAHTIGNIPAPLRSGLAP